LTVGNQVHRYKRRKTCFHPPQFCPLSIMMLDMPRTKMPRKKSSMLKKAKLSMRPAPSVESLASSASSATETPDDLLNLLNTTYESVDQFKKAVEVFFEKRVELRKKSYEDSVQIVKNTIANLRSKNPKSFLNANLQSRFDESILKDIDIEPNEKVVTEHRSRLQSSNKEPTEFKKPRTPRRTSRASSKSSHKRSLSAPAPSAPVPPPVFKTPLNRAQMAGLKTITPKVSNTPVSVMRRPQHGEVAFSTSGSPLLISAVSREDIPTVSVPLIDGRVFSILPDPGLPPSDLPEFDDDTKKYLRTLREHLAMLSSSP